MRLAMLACVGCGSSTTSVDDCKLVLGDLSHAPANVTARYPGEPVKVAETIERCVAPDGDDCERSAKVVAAIPAMMPGAKKSGGDYVALCRSSPPELRRCLLPSYIIAHAEDCANAIEDTAFASLDIKPKGRTVDAREPVVLSLLVDLDGIWLARTSSTRCFAPRRTGSLDLDWLRTELMSLRDPDSSAIEIAGKSAVPYQEIITVMDIAVQRGLIDAGLSEPDGLGVSFAGIDRAKALRHCDPSAKPTPKAGSDVAPATAHGTSGMTDRRPETGSDAPAKTGNGASVNAASDPLDPPPARPKLAEGPVVQITRTEIAVVKGNDRTTVAPLAAVATGSGPITRLERALPANSTNGMAILQADQQTDMRVISRVVETLKHAGYDNVLFAVKSK
jgi:biopolymer transport protein ExbD